ncbi:fungal-specific transcription factor domain-containing protein [Mrakia frigida]|uniref:transcription factor domain-containing protein n=1 Tax=Mrakia frigida TaxID=29902 RepID=UPI003FCC176A
MSSKPNRTRNHLEEEEEESPSSTKGRKISRACDKCRIAKVRCDGADAPGNCCTNCITGGLACSYEEPSKRRNIPKGYVESIELRLKRLTELITQIRPDINLEEELGGPLVLDQADFSGRRPAIKPKSEPFNSLSFPPRQSSSTSNDSLDASSPRLSPSFASSSKQPSPPPSLSRRLPHISLSAERRQKGKDADEDDLTRGFVKLARPDEVEIKSFQGKSSAIPLLLSAAGFKYGPKSQTYWDEIALHPSSLEVLLHQTPIWQRTLEPRAWNTDASPMSPKFFALTSPNIFDTWPDESLATLLIDSYFGYPSEGIPLLQRSHFLSQYHTQQLYFAHEGFARLCLLVFAVGSLYLDDLRVNFPRSEDARSRGWIYFHAFRKIDKSPIMPTDLYDLQIAVLLAMFLRVQCGQPRASWMITGQGLRAAVDIGAHRRGTQRSDDPVENELFRRAFWCLQVLDIEFSGNLGRPSNLPEADYDATLDSNSAFWEDRRQQLQDEPSYRVEAFTLHCRLSVILARISAKLYGINPRAQGYTSIQIVEELGSQLQEWFRSIPPALHWNPSANLGNTLIFRLAAALHLSYQNAVAFLHRPFLPSPQHPQSTSPAFMNTTFSAALEAVQIMEEYDRRTGQLPAPGFFACYGSAMVLSLCVWGGASTSGNGAMSASIAMGGVETCVELLERFSKRFWGLSQTLGPIAVLAAPRVDYLSESVSRRQVREKKVAEARALQVALRNDPTTLPTRSPHSSSSPPAPSPFPPRPSSITSSAQPPSLNFQPYANPSTFSESPDLPPRPSVVGAEFNMNDFLSMGGGDAMFNSMDFLTAGNDPLMTLFPGSPQPPSLQHQQLYPSYPPNLENQPFNSGPSNPGAVLPDVGLASPGSWAVMMGSGGQAQDQAYGSYGNGASWEESRGGAGPSTRP